MVASKNLPSLQERQLFIVPPSQVLQVLSQGWHSLFVSAYFVDGHYTTQIVRSKYLVALQLSQLVAVPEQVEQFTLQANI